MSAAEPSPGAGASIAPKVRGEALTGLEMRPGDAAQRVADRLAALTARAAGAPTAMLHLAEGSSMRAVGGYGLPDGFMSMDPAPATSTLAGLVIHHGFPVVIEDVATDARVPPDAPVRAVGIGSYAGFPVRDPAGVIVGVCAVADFRPRCWQPAELSAVDDGAQACTALVAQRYASQEAERQRHFLDILLDSLDTGVLACDDRGQLLVVNRSLRQKLGILPAEQPPERWLPELPVRHPDGRPFTSEEVPLLQALTGRQVHGVEHTAATPQGTQRLYAVNAHPITGPAGRRLGAVSVFHDITDRRRMERFRTCEFDVALALNEARSLDEVAAPILKEIAGTLGWPCAELWMVEPSLDGEVLRRVVRYRAEDTPAALPATVKLDRGEGLAGAAWESGRSVWRTGGETGGQTREQTREQTGGDGTGWPCAAVAVPVRSGGYTLAVLSVHSDQLEARDDAVLTMLSGVATHIGQFIERRRAENLQDVLSVSKDEFLDLIGHELRTPLTVVACSIELLDDADPATTLGEVKSLTTAIRRGSDRLRHLVESLLELSRLDSSDAVLTREPVDFSDIVRTAVEDARPRCDAKELAVSTGIGPGVLLTGDRPRLQQMVAALLDNAVTYSPRGTHVHLELARAEDSAALTVTDTGAGIPEAERPYVFQRFYRGEVATEHAIPGVGLGLPIALLIAQRHHGDITLESGPGGTTVRVELPLRAERPPERR